MPRKRAIQIGLSRELSEYFVENILRVEDVTTLAGYVQEAHKLQVQRSKGKQTKGLNYSGRALPMSIEELFQSGLLPIERPYMPNCSPPALVTLGMKPGSTAADSMAHHCNPDLRDGESKR